MQRIEENAVRRARCVGIAAHHYIQVVSAACVVPQDGIAEQDRARRAHRIDRCVNRAVAVAPEPMSCHPRGVNVVTAALVVRIKRISQSRRRVRHRELRHRATDIQEGLLDSTGRRRRPSKIPDVIEPQHNRCRRVGHVVILERVIREEEPMESP